MSSDHDVTGACDDDSAVGRGAAQKGDGLAVHQDADDTLGNRISTGRTVSDPQSGQAIDQHIGGATGGGVSAVSGFGAELDKKNAALDQANDKFDQAMKAMQQSQQVQTQQSLALTQGLQKVAEGQEQANKVMASMQQILVGMQADQAKTATPTSDTKPAENTNKQENGGN